MFLDDLTEPTEAGEPVGPPLDEARALLQRVVRRFGPRLVLVSALGPQSLLVLDLLVELGHRPDVAFLETGAHFPETLALLGAVEARYGLVIRRVAPEAVVERQWATDPIACCEARKVEPLRRLLVRYDAWISGVRADQTDSRASAQALAWDASYGLWKVNPLVGWSRSQVDAELLRRGAPTNPLLRRGYGSVGCAPCTRPSAGERDGRFVGQGRQECGIHLRGAGGAA
jgi:phosphoadenosine phosphosulfate reductase